MKFITIKDNKIVGTREAKEIVEGEVVDDGTYGNLGEILIDGVWQKDPLEIAEQEKRQRISQLKEVITNKNYLSEVVTTEQAELKILLQTVEYLSVESQIQSAIDDYTLSLIEGGLL